MPRPKREMQQTAVYLFNRQCLALKKLAAITGIPYADFIREGVDRVLRDYSTNLPAEMRPPAEQPPAPAGAGG